MSAILFVTPLRKWQSFQWGGNQITLFSPASTWDLSHFGAQTRTPGWLQRSLAPFLLKTEHIVFVTEMSIETLLEAAKFLELQAQQQQKARGMLVFYYIYSNILGGGD